MDIQDRQDKKGINPVHPVYLCEKKTSMNMQDKQDRDLKHGEITKTVIGCAFEVMNEMGAGFLESVYGKAMLLALRQKGLSAVAQHPVRVSFRGECVGEFFADLFVDNKVIVELKAVKALVPEHQAQVINYLNATGIEVGLLINFGNPKIEYKRFTRNKNLDIDRQDRQDTNSLSCSSCISM
jgi:GxxExxY protein